MGKRAILFSLIILGFALLSYFFLDKELARYFSHDPLGIRVFFSFITNFGLSEIYLIPSALIFFIARKRNKHLAYGALSLFLSVALSGITAIIIKIIAARFRPPALLHENLFGFNWFEFGYMVNSFPSGHATTAFSAFITLALLLPKFAKLFIPLAFLIAFSRVVVGVHYLSDVMVGALLGTLWAYYIYNRVYRGIR